MKMPYPRYLVLHNFLPSWKDVQADCNLVEAFALSSFVPASTSGALTSCGNRIRKKTQNVR